MRDTWWSSGQYNVICDVCGFKLKNTDLQRRWDGLMVCEQDYEIQHPQERIRPIPDQQKPQVTRPGGTDVFIDNGSASGLPNPGGVCTIYTRQAIADTGTADCATIGWSVFYGAVYPPT